MKTKTLIFLISLLYITLAKAQYGIEPTAVAGADQNLTDNDGNGSESAFLDGSSSLDADGTIVSYLWTEGTNQLSTSDTVTLDFTVGTHTVVLTVEDNDGLTGVDTVIITVNAVTNTINIQNNNLISIYPNPFNNYINIENNNVKIIELSIIDINGKVILQSKNCNKLNTEKLRAGIYFCKIKTSNTIIVNKLIKQ